MGSEASCASSMRSTSSMSRVSSAAYMSGHSTLNSSMGLLTGINHIFDEYRYEDIFNRYEECKITQVQIYESPINNQWIGVLNIFMKEKLNHCSIILSINQIMHLILDYGKQGLEIEVSLSQE